MYLYIFKPSCQEYSQKILGMDGKTPSAYCPMDSETEEIELVQKVRIGQGSACHL